MVAGVGFERLSRFAKPMRLHGWTAALLLSVAVFGLYGLTAGALEGYEPETAAVSEGLVTSGQLRVLPDSRISPGGGLFGRDGKRYGRQGLTQPVLEAPFFWVGLKLDQLGSDGRRDSWRLAMLRLYNPLMAALTVLAVFALLSLRGVSERRALGVAGLSAVATLIWPYSKVGMDTTLMAMIALSFVAAAWAAARPTALRFMLVGIAAGLAANSKPYGVFLLVGVVPLLWRPFQQLPPRQRAHVVAALVAPLVLAVIAGGWYNWYRTGSVTNFMNNYIAAPVAAPISAIGLLISPGKGLLLYSPLVILGLVGFKAMWRADRRLALAIVLTVVANTAVIAISLSWTDETWGPRYLVPSAWLLVLPIAWWVKGRTRARWLTGVATVGVCVQVAAVLGNYGDAIAVGAALSGGENVYGYGHPVAYGDDGPRWVPGASPLLFQVELAAAYIKEQLTGSGFRVTYDPYRGSSATIDLTHPTRTFQLPDFWWAHTTGSKVRLLAVLLGVLSLGSALVLVRGRAFTRPPPAPTRATSA
jgi:hypothetical protein